MMTNTATKTFHVSLVAKDRFDNKCLGFIMTAK